MNFLSLTTCLADGTWPVMLTAFDAGGRVDSAGMDALLGWYLDQGVAGLFACCSSSEVFELSWEEKEALTRQTVAAAAGRAQVLGSVMGERGGRTLAEAVTKVAAWGVDAVVLNLAELADAGESDGTVEETIDSLLDAVAASIPLGLYECPAPYHRLAGTELLRRVAGTGRFVFFKDTCCDAGVLRERLDAVAGTGLKLFNAHTPLMSGAIAHGCAGFCGIGANFYPGLYGRLHAAVVRGDQVEAADTQAELDRLDPVAHRAYPRSAKAFLAASGVAIGTTCRRSVASLPADWPGPLAPLLPAVSSAV